ncbi:hypothetical protein ACF09J_06415 [Streptomyces sp. NPDC014889]|uniref:hypothetical protein n=1 Tax=Streptomyces sp. NPDC014889 TaxID=3364928 RepID=UPI0037028E5C
METEDWGLTFLALAAFAAAFARAGQPWRYKWILPTGLLAAVAVGLLSGNSDWNWYGIPFLLIAVGGVLDGLWISGIWRPGGKSFRSNGKRRRQG